MTIKKATGNFQIYSYEFGDFPTSLSIKCEICADFYGQGEISAGKCSICRNGRRRLHKDMQQQRILSLWVRNQKLFWRDRFGNYAENRTGSGLPDAFAQAGHEAGGRQLPGGGDRPEQRRRELDAAPGDPGPGALSQGGRNGGDLRHAARRRYRRGQSQRQHPYGTPGASDAHGGGHGLL